MANTIGTAYIQIEPTTKGIGGAISSALDGEASSAGSSAGSKFAGAFGTAAKIAGGALIATTAAAGAFAKASIEAGSTFDSAMSQVGATMGFTVDEINSAGTEANTTMQRLRDFAQEMGSTTAFSASEAAEALNYMALAGYDADTSIEMLPTVLNLAAAGGMDLASASDMVTDASSALGLSLDETSQMTDKMAAAASKSNTSVAQLGEAYLAVGGTAKSLKGGTTELSTVLGLLADNGIKGSEAGTHLRNIMLAMNPTTDKAIQAWTELGISAYDADGNLRPLEDTFADLNGAMANMTDQEKTNILTKMFNKTDLSSINALLATSSERWGELSTAIDDSRNAASDMAAVQLDNLSGDITLFQSALEGAKIAVSDQLTPTLREFVQFGSDGLSRLTEAFQTGGLSGAMSELGTLLAEAISQLTAMLPDIVTVGAELLKALADGIVQNLPQLASAAIDIIKFLADGLIQGLPEMINGATDLLNNLTTYLQNNGTQMVQSGIQLVGNLASGILENLPQLIAAAAQLIATLAVNIIQNLPQIIQTGVQLVISLGAGLVQALPQLMGTVATLVRGIIDFFKNTDWISIGDNIIEGIKNGVTAKASELFSSIKDIAKQALDSAKSALGIHSPSKEFAWIGEMCTAGFNKGIADLSDGVFTTDGIRSFTSSIITDSNPQDSGVMSLLGQYLPQIAQGNQIVLDSGALVGSIAPQMDSNMGRLSTFRERYN